MFYFKGVTLILGIWGAGAGYHGDLLGTDWAVGCLLDSDHALGCPSSPNLHSWL